MDGSVLLRRPSAVLDMGAEIGDLDKEGVYASDSPAMILTCPECATRYFVDDDRVGPAGRDVRCASCGHRWTAKPEVEPLVLAQSPEIGAAAEALPLAPQPVAAAHELPAEELPKVFRDRARTRLKEREAAAVGVIWAALIGALGVLVGTLILLRADVAQIWPRTASVYAMIGLPVNLIGLTIEDQHAQPMLKDGHADLAISGALRNIRGKPVDPPPLRISLLGPGGRVVVTQIANPGAAVIPPGEVRRFVVDIIDPPVSATDVEIAFVFNGHPPPPPPRPPPPKRPVDGVPPPVTLDLRGVTAPSATEAQPLPSSSPYALPESANLSGGHG